MKFKEIIQAYNFNSVSSSELMTAISSLYPILDVAERFHPKEFWIAMCNFHEHIKGKHFNEMYAKYQVGEMYHVDKSGKVCKGEVYDINEAKKIYELKVKPIASFYNCWDVYVALNAQYHDYAKMFKDWHDDISNDDLDKKIVCSAITFWFKDEDAEDGKVWNYFKSMN